MGGVQTSKPLKLGWGQISHWDGLNPSTLESKPSKTR